MTDVDESEGRVPPVDSVFSERYGWASLPRAKPHERLTRGMAPEDFFGICADEIDDEFIEAVTAIRRGEWPRSSGHD